MKFRWASCLPDDGLRSPRPAKPPHTTRRAVPGNWPKKVWAG